MDFSSASLPDIELGGLRLSNCKDRWDEDWFLGINRVAIATRYPKPDLGLLKKACSLIKIESVLDLCCGFRPVSDLLFDSKISTNPPSIRGLVDYKDQVHLLKERVNDNPLIVHFDLREIENPNSAGYDYFKEKVLSRKWDLILAVNAFNYINWRQTIRVLSRNQSDEGLFFVTNNPLAGYWNYFYPGGTPMNSEITEYFNKNRYALVERKGEDLAHILAQKK